MTEAAELVYPDVGPAAPPQQIEAEASPEEEVEGPCGQVAQTPWFSTLYGSVLVGGAPARAGTRIEVVTPRGEVAGCFTVVNAGQYGFVAAYGEDATANPPIPGFRDGEQIALRVNGMPATRSEPMTWSDDKTPRRADLQVEGINDLLKSYLPLISR